MSKAGLKIKSNKIAKLDTILTLVELTKEKINNLEKTVIDWVSQQAGIAVDPGICVCPMTTKQRKWNWIRELGLHCCINKHFHHSYEELSYEVPSVMDFGVFLS